MKKNIAAPLIAAWRARGPLAPGSTWWWMLARGELRSIPTSREVMEPAVQIGSSLPGGDEHQDQMLAVILADHCATLLSAVDVLTASSIEAALGSWADDGNVVHFIDGAMEAERAGRCVLVFMGKTGWTARQDRETGVSRLTQLSVIADLDVILRG